MLKKSLILFILILTFTFGTSNAQYTPEHHYLGPSIGLSFLGSAPQFGINYEYSMDLQNFGSVGIGGLFRYWGYSESFGYFDGSGEWKYTNILIGAQGNYHFKIPESKFDPFAGIVLAYDVASTSWSGPYNYGASVSAGGFWIAVQGGARYWISPTVAINARVGFGSLSYGALEVGVDFKL